jgi:hypothetical protein
MSTIPNWVTPPGTLGTIPEGVFYSVPLKAVSNGTVYYRVIAGQLPRGIQIDENGILSGNPQAVTTVQGVPANVVKDTTSQFAVRAYTQRNVNGVIVIDKLADRTFTLTVTGQTTVVWTTPAGNVGTYFNGVQVTDLQLQYTSYATYTNNLIDIYADVPVVTLIAGALPPGLTVSTSGVISGYITPNSSATATTTSYSFTLRVSNSTSSDVRTFSMLIYARSTMTGDNTHLRADNTFVTADESPQQPPIITTPTGSIGSTRSDNFYAFQFTGFDFNGNAFKFIARNELPPGLTLDSNSGWLYGYIPYGGIFSEDYSFDIQVYETLDPSNRSELYTFSLTITGPVNLDITWLTPINAVERARTPSSLGAIDNGATSTFYVEAVNVSGIPLQYQLLSGSNSRLPQGLQLLPSGHIAGRVSFDTFALDGGTTVFDVDLRTVDQPTTFDMVAVFTVNAFSIDGQISSNKTFSITVVRRYQEPYDNLYIQAMPPQDDRALLNSLLQNPNIFPPNLIYRNDDPNFGVATRVIYNHAYRLTAATLDDYVASMNLNHYWKNLVLGEIKTARALDDNGNVIYEVVYSEVVDNLINNDGISVGKEVVLAFPIDANTPAEIDAVWPNSLQDMRDQVIDVVGQVSNVLPRWMLSQQANGQVLGFTPAWVIAYTNPGESGQIAYNIQTQFGTKLNLVDFEVDRYELDNLLTKNWNREQQHWGYAGDPVTPYPATLTRFDYGSANFNIDPWINNFVEYYTISSIVGNGTRATVTWSPILILPVYINTTQYYAGDRVVYNNSNYTAIATTLGNLPSNSSYWRLSNTFTPGQVVNISGVVPGVYNGNVTVINCTKNSFTFASSSTVRTGRTGRITTIPAVVNWVNNADQIVVWTNDYNGQPTIFDENSLQFTAPVDMYSHTNEYDKYLVFPKRNILE